jgi:branched-chain amino acid aminotransferase
MHEFISFNGKILAANETAVPAVSSAALYGRGVFTTIAVYDEVPFLWEKHWERLVGDSATIGLEIGAFSETGVLGSLAELLARNGVKTGRTRLTFFDRSGGGAWPAQVGNGVDLLIITADARPVPEKFRLTVSPYLLNSRSPLTGVKSCNYLENLMALEEARSRGFDEAVRINEYGDIASACMANIFLRKDGRFFTPQLISGGLAGTTREFFIEKADAEECVAVIEDLRFADAVMLTSAGLGVVEVSEFDERKYQTGVYDLTKIMCGW